MMSSDGLERLVVRPVGSAQDLPFARALMSDIDQVIADTPAEDVEIVFISSDMRPRRLPPWLVARFAEAGYSAAGEA